MIAVRQGTQIKDEIKERYIERAGERAVCVCEYVCVCMSVCLSCWCWRKNKANIPVYIKLYLADHTQLTYITSSSLVFIQLWQSALSGGCVCCCCCCWFSVYPWLSALLMWFIRIWGNSFDLFVSNRKVQFLYFWCFIVIKSDQNMF